MKTTKWFLFFTLWMERLKSSYHGGIHSTGIKADKQDKFRIVHIKSLNIVFPFLTSLILIIVNVFGLLECPNCSPDILYWKITRSNFVIIELSSDDERG